MEWKLEVIVLPVSDSERSKTFYEQQLGFGLDVDVRPSEGMRIIQLTPTGSGCSVTFGEGLSASEPGSLKGLQLTVTDIDAAHAELSGRGVEITPVRHVEEGVWLD